MAIAGGDNPRVDTVRVATARTTVQAVNGRIGAEIIPAMIAAIAVVPTGGNVKITAENVAEIEVSIGDITGAGAVLTAIIAARSGAMSAGNGKHKHPARANIHTGYATLGIAQKNGAMRMNHRFLRG